jgi:hypothetical protein
LPSPPPQALSNRRLLNQGLSASRLTRPEEVVRSLGAVQAQDYPGAKWALGLRMTRATDEAVERALAEGRILRTHVLRPTWHFVTPADIRWMLALSAPRVHAAMAYYRRQHGLDAAALTRSEKAIARAMRGAAELARDELTKAVRGAGVTMVTGTLSHILMHAELNAVICSGARRGRQFTYALLDDRVPAVRALSRHEALAELTRRYFTSHGPAQVGDFAWWSGLTVKDARAGLEMVQRDVVSETIDGKMYWCSKSKGTIRQSAPAAHLLPVFDEYLVAYKDRGTSLDFAPIVVRGQVVGAWKRTLMKQKVVLSLAFYAPVTKADQRAVAEAAHRYSAFVGLDVAFG